MDGQQNIKNGYGIIQLNVLDREMKVQSQSNLRNIT